jgi:prolyl-tRNA editing enzyme YbaK/EbsC (Cys-tRNA(Pro) deacylase)
MATPRVYNDILELLSSSGIPYREVTHEPTRTSAESAKARGLDVSLGGKAILLKVGDEFKLFVLSAARKLDSQKVRQHFGERKLRFATPEELLTMTGLVPGSVPPFGRPITNFDLFVDKSITENTVIAFNAGSLTTSIIMDCKDYLKITSPQVFEFSA